MYELGSCQTAAPFIDKGKTLFSNVHSQLGCFQAIDLLHEDCPPVSIKHQL
jgi:hypothetical protein